MVERMENAFDRAGGKLKKLFSKEVNSPTDEVESEEIKTALQVRIQGIVKERDVDYYLVNTWMIYDSNRQ